MDYGERVDKTKKGRGFFGELKRKNGEISTELSIGVEIDGKEVQIPLLVPTLDKSDISYLLRTDEEVSEFPESIIDKAYRHALERIKQGRSPFIEDDEKQYPVTLGR